MPGKESNNTYGVRANRPAIVEQSQGDAPVLAGGNIAGCSPLGPVDDCLDRALLVADAGFTEGVTYGCHSCGQELGRRRIVPQQVPGNATLPKLVETGGVAGQGGFQVVADLAVEGRALADQIAAVADQQLQRRPGFIAGGLHQRTAGDGGAVHGAQVGVVGLVPGINRLAILFGDKRMEDPGLEAGGREGTLDEAVVATGAFDGDEAIPEFVVGKGQSNPGAGGVELGAVMGDPGRRDEDVAIKVGQEELGTRLGRVEADDAEVLRADLLHARVQHAARFADVGFRPTGGRAFASTCGGHHANLRKKGWGSSHFRSWHSREVFFS